MLTISEQESLNRKLAWAKYRMDMLEKIAEKQKMIEQISKLIESKKLEETERQTLTGKLQQLLSEVQELDHTSSICW